MKSGVIGIIPPQWRGRLLWMALSSFLSALIDMVGVAVIAGVMLLVLKPDAVHSVAFFDRAFRLCGFVAGHENLFIALLGCAMVVAVVLKNAAALWLSNRRMRFALGLQNALSSAVFDSYLSGGLQSMLEGNSARAVNDIMSLCSRFAVSVVLGRLTLLAEVLVAVLILVALTCYSPLLALLAVAVFVPVGLIYALVIRRYMERNGKRENSMVVALRGGVLEAMRGYADIEINNARAHVVERHSGGMRDYARLRLRSSLVAGVSSRLAEVALVAGVAAVIIVAIWRDADMESLRIMLGVFAVAAYRMVPAVGKISNMAAELRRSRFVTDTLAKALSHPTAVTQSTDERMALVHNIRLDGVTFAYGESDPIVRNLDALVPAGEWCGITGPSGVGKSTLVNLVASLLKPLAGHIRVDGVELDDSNSRLWLNNIGYAQQHPFIADGSLRDNIAFFQEQIDDERVAQVIALASLDALASGPEGIDIQLGEGGCRISAGERQRVAIARALYRNVDLLILDEATSALDGDTEAKILDAIYALFLTHRMTVIVVSHHQSALKYCRNIIRLG